MRRCVSKCAAIGISKRMTPTCWISCRYFGARSDDILRIWDQESNTIIKQNTETDGTRTSFYNKTKEAYSKPMNLIVRDLVKVRSGQRKPPCGPTGIICFSAFRARLEFTWWGPETFKCNSPLLKLSPSKKHHALSRGFGSCR